jgi:DNA-binding response OmpR family regulator
MVMLSEGEAMHRVLIVEDEDQLRHILARNLQARGYAISEAGDVSHAVERCTVATPDVMVLDLNLPDGSGWDVLRALAARGVARPNLVVASAVPPTHSRLVEFGPLTFLEKPFPIQALLRAVGRAVTEADGHGERNPSSI